MVPHRYAAAVQSEMVKFDVWRPDHARFRIRDPPPSDYVLSVARCVLRARDTTNHLTGYSVDATRPSDVFVSDAQSTPCALALAGGQVASILADAVRPGEDL